MGKEWFLLLGDKDKQIVHDIVVAYPELKERPQIEVEEAYKDFLKSLGIKREN